MFSRILVLFPTPKWAYAPGFYIFKFGSFKRRQKLSRAYADQKIFPFLRVEFSKKRPAASPR